MNAKQERKGGSPPIPGVVEVDGAPPTKNFITRLAEGIINGRAPTSVVPFSELIPELRKIEDGGGNLREYIEELEERAKTENHNNGRIFPHSGLLFNWIGRCLNPRWRAFKHDCRCQA